MYCIKFQNLRRLGLKESNQKKEYIAKQLNEIKNVFYFKPYYIGYGKGEIDYIDSHSIKTIEYTKGEIKSQYPFFRILAFYLFYNRVVMIL